MANFKFGDKVRVRDKDYDDWEEGIYLDESNDCEFPYSVYINSDLSIYWRFCELVEAVPDVLRPKFKLGDKVAHSDDETLCLGEVLSVDIAYTLSADPFQSIWREKDLTIFKKEIKIGDKVRFNSHRNGTVLAKFTDLSDSDCVVVHWPDLTYGRIELTKNLEHEYD